MEWFLIVAFVVFMVGLGIVTVDAIRHASKTTHGKSAKPTR
jgi:hypothetical protein